MSKDDGDLEALEAVIRRVLPRVMEGRPNSPCPDDNTMAEFLDGRLRGKRLKDLYSHLLICGDCVEAIRTFHNITSIREDEREEPPEELREKVKKLFPPEPKEWEIRLKMVKRRISITSYTGEIGLTFPELGSLPTGKGKELTLDDRRQIIRSIEAVSPQHASLIGKVEQIESDLASVNEEIDRLKDVLDKKDYDQREELLSRKKKELSEQLSEIEIREPAGFFFQNRLWNFDMNLFLTNVQADTSDFIELQAGISSSRETPEAVEVSFMQGRKVIEKAVPLTETLLSRQLTPGKFGLRIRQYGIYLGRLTVDLKK